MEGLLGSNDVVLVIAGSILMVAVGLYVLWYRRATRRLASALRRTRAVLGVDDWTVAQVAMENEVRRGGSIASTWVETASRVFLIPQGGRPEHVTLGSPAELWSANRILGRAINLPLAEAIPNVLVGIGLFFTFLFLTMALVAASSAIGPQAAGGVGGGADQAIQDLLHAAGGKFLTSMAGLFGSLAWTIASRSELTSVQRLSDDVVALIGKLVHFDGGERLLQAQLKASRDTREEAAAQVGLSEELLTEAREQSGTLKRFETDLAVSLASAITSAFTPQMEQMTSRLTAAIDSLSLKIGTMNQDALHKMMEEFSATLTKATDSEMSQLRATLSELAQSLHTAGGALGSSATEAASHLGAAGSALVTSMDEIATKLSAGASSLEVAIQTTKLAMNDLDVSVSNAAQLGRRGAAVFDEVIGRVEDTLAGLSGALDSLRESSGSLERFGGQLTEVVDSVEELSSEQRAVVNAVRQATPEALKAIEQVVAVLQSTIAHTSGTMAETRAAMKDTASALGDTVSQITTGVTEYSTAVANLHRTMDDKLSQAIGGLNTTVTDLGDTVEELADVMSRGSKG